MSLDDLVEFLIAIGVIVYYLFKVLGKRTGESSESYEVPAGGGWEDHPQADEAWDGEAYEAPRRGAVHGEVYRESERPPPPPARELPRLGVQSVCRPQRHEMREALILHTIFAPPAALRRMGMNRPRAGGALLHRSGA